MTLARTVIEKLTDYRSAPKTYLGWSSIAFRDSKAANRPSNVGPFYVLGGGNDSWFRSTEGNSKGYGLAIIQLSVASKTPVDFGDFNAYKAKMRYIPSGKEAPKDAVNEAIWLLVHKSKTLEEVLKHIEKHSSEWRP